MKMGAWIHGGDEMPLGAQIAAVVECGVRTIRYTQV